MYITRRFQLLLLSSNICLIFLIASCSTAKTSVSAVPAPIALGTTSHTDLVLALAWSPDSQRIASAGSDDTVQIWDARTGQHFLTYHGHTNTVEAVAWSQDGTRIASASFDDTVQVWHVATGQRILTY